VLYRRVRDVNGKTLFLVLTRARAIPIARNSIAYTKIAPENVVSANGSTLEMIFVDRFTIFINIKRRVTNRQRPRLVSYLCVRDTRFRATTHRPADVPSASLYYVFRLRLCCTRVRRCNGGAGEEKKYVVVYARYFQIYYLSESQKVSATEQRADGVFFLFPVVDRALVPFDRSIRPTARRRRRRYY